MTNHSEMDSKDEEDLQREGSVPETPKNENETKENETPASSCDSRKKNLSKREIMEELSRARFPWDE
ncbi:hypothetical protein [Polynucleobacter sp. MWH-HuK1]|uniref:hypothetical protein n=1 Tax=Polynucleobacter sp. MWH-HuK1 TaxID=1743158 RepID=UPI001C0AF490|nr:hypothetical protein [Polynucleobacter sp. MWH-HuK1]MBU3565506.1 hypothetical protein [Polynucleobacter sp. MWH-HuK1]